jgi:hypothetical protein
VAGGRLVAGSDEDAHLGAEQVEAPFELAHDVRVVTVAGVEVAWSEVDWLTAELVESLEVVELEPLDPAALLDVLDVLVDALADSAGSSPRAIWTASAPVSASAAPTAIAVIFAVSAVMAGTIARPPQRNLGNG